MFWLGGSPRLPSLRPLLEATEKLVVATSIVNVWAYDPAQLAAEYAALARDFPERLLVGIGVGHPEATSDYSQAVLGDAGVPRRSRRGPTTAAARSPLPCGAGAEDARPERRALARRDSLLRPRRPYRGCAGTARRRRLLAPEVAFVLDDDADRARAKAREYARTYLGLSNYTSNLLRLRLQRGDIAAGGSDRLIDAVIPHGTADEIATLSVRISMPARTMSPCRPVGEPGIPRQGWAGLAEALFR